MKRKPEPFQLRKVGTPRRGVPGRVQRPELLQTTTIKGPRCAAGRGADSAARCPYRYRRSSSLAIGLLALALCPARAHASIFKGEALDTAADVLTWIVLAVAPIVGIVVFLLVHILPEKIAEKKEHPQAKAIQCLCLLSLVFGGLLWPLAWLWAYSKPVFYRMAYGTDKVPHGHEEEKPAPAKDEAEELKQLRKRVAELEAKSAGKPAAEGGKA